MQVLLVLSKYSCCVLRTGQVRQKVILEEQVRQLASQLLQVKGFPEAVKPTGQPKIQEEVEPI